MKKIVIILLLSVILLGIVSCSKPDYTGVWLAFMVEDENGKQYSMLEYFSSLKDEYTVIMKINKDGTYVCSTFIGDDFIDDENGTYKQKGEKIYFTKDKTYTGQMVNGYLAIKYDKATMYFGKTSDLKKNKN